MSRIRQRMVCFVRKLAAAFVQPAALTLCLWGFASGMSALLVGSTLSIWLRSSGWNLRSIGLLSLVGLFYAFKFLWAPWLDRYGLPWLNRLGRRRSWLLAVQLLLIALIAAMGLSGPSAERIFTLLIVLTAWTGATQDMLIDAYRIEIAGQEAQGALVATYSLGYRIGMVCGGALALYIAEFLSWRWAYLGMALLLLPALAASWRSREPAPAPVAAKQTIMASYQAFFRRYGWRSGCSILAFLGLFKLPDLLISVVSGPFYLDSGFSPVDIATVSKFYAIWISVAGAFLGAFLLASWDRWKALWLSAVLLALSNLLYLLLAFYPGQLWAFVLAISGDYAAQGLAGTVLVAFMSELTSRRHTATQYAFLSSLAFLPGRLLGGLSGYMAEYLGYASFFALSAVSIIPTLWLLARLRGRLVLKADSPWGTADQLASAYKPTLKKPG